MVYSTSLCLEDVGTYSNQIGIISNDVWLMASEMEINRSLFTQLDVGSSDGELVTTTSSDNSQSEGGTSLSSTTETGIDEFESAENLCGLSRSKTNGLEGHHTTLGNKQDSETGMNHTGATTNHTDSVCRDGSPVIALKRPASLEDIILTSPLNIPVIVTRFKNK